MPAKSKRKTWLLPAASGRNGAAAVRMQRLRSVLSRRRTNSVTNFEIIETLAVLSERDRAGFQKELNVTAGVAGSLNMISGDGRRIIKK